MAEKKVRLTFVRDQYIYAGDTLSLDVSNQLTGNDEGVAYSCYYDAVVDGVVGTALGCDLFPEPQLKSLIRSLGP